MGFVTPILAILAIVGLEALALHKGMHGTSLAISIGAISGLGGYTVKRLIDGFRK